jgi:hypothetical protein
MFLLLSGLFMILKKLLNTLPWRLSNQILSSQTPRLLHLPQKRLEKTHLSGSRHAPKNRTKHQIIP